MIDALGRFESRENFHLPYRHTRPPFALGQQGVQDYYIVWCLNLGGDNSRESRTENGFKVVTSQPCVKGVDTHGQKRSTIMQTLECLSDVGTRGAFVRV